MSATPNPPEVTIPPRRPPVAQQDAFGPPLPTPDEAADAGRVGYGVRCNRCGGYGGAWIPGARSDGGSLALCHPHKEELEAMQRRHAEELRAFTATQSTPGHGA